MTTYMTRIVDYYRKLNKHYETVAKLYLEEPIPPISISYHKSEYPKVYIGIYIGDCRIVNLNQDSQSYLNQGCVMTLIFSNNGSIIFKMTKNKWDDISIKKRFLFPHTINSGIVAGKYEMSDILYTCCTNGDNQLKDLSHLIEERLKGDTENFVDISDEEALMDAMVHYEYIKGYLSYESYEGSMYYNLSEVTNNAMGVSTIFLKSSYNHKVLSYGIGNMIISDGENVFTKYPEVIQYVMSFLPHLKNYQDYILLSINLYNKFESVMYHTQNVTEVYNENGIWYHYEAGADFSQNSKSFRKIKANIEAHYDTMKETLVEDSTLEFDKIEHIKLKSYVKPETQLAVYYPYVIQLINYCKFITSYEYA